MKNNRFYSALFSILLIGIATGCIPGTITRAYGDAISQERSVADFNGIIVNGIGNVNIYRSESYKLIVNADSEIQDMIETQVNGDFLHIDVKIRGISFRRINTTITIDVYMPEIKSLSANGATEIKIADGKTSDLEIQISGASRIDAENYEAQNVDIALSGASDAKIWATNLLNYRISGVCNISYKGNPTLTGRISGLGSIERL